MELRQLRHLVAIAEHKSFSEAAARVYLSQPALTRSIQELEKHLGMKLVTRSTRSVALTPAGERFCQYATLIVQQCRDAKSCVADIQEGVTGDVTVGVGQFFSNIIIASAILQCRTRLPNITLRIVSGTLDELCGRIKQQSIDFAFCSFSDLTSSSAVIVEPLMRLADVIVANPGHPLLMLRKPDPQLLSSSRWAVIDRRYAIDAHANLFASLGLHVPRPVRTNSLALIVSLVARRGYLAMLPREVVAADLHAGAIRVLPTPSLSPERRAGLLHAAGTSNPAAARVMQVVRDTCLKRGGVPINAAKRQ